MNALNNSKKVEWVNSGRTHASQGQSLYFEGVRQTKQAIRLNERRFGSVEGLHGIVILIGPTCICNSLCDSHAKKIDYAGHHC